MNNVINTKVCIFRNLKDYKFTSKLEDETKQKIAEIVNNEVKDEMAFLPISKADNKVMKFLKGNNLILNNTQNLFVHKSKTLAINLFNGEHLTLTSTGNGYSSSIIDQAVELSNKLNNKLSFSYTDEYGYLMSDISKIGSGIKVEANIMLSALVTINKIDQVAQNVAKLGYSLKETNYPAVFTLSTTCNLGVGEKQIFDDFENTLKRLQDLEIESVKMLDATDHDTLIDKVERSFALLNASHLMNYEELYNHIVNLRMGLNAGIAEIKPEILNKLQKLIQEKTNDLTSQAELKELAQTAKNILKGE